MFLFVEDPVGGPASFTFSIFNYCIQCVFIFSQCLPYIAREADVTWAPVVDLGNFIFLVSDMVRKVSQD